MRALASVWIDNGKTRLMTFSANTRSEYSRQCEIALTHLPVQPLSRVKSLDGPRVRVISPVVKEKVYGGKDLLKSQVLSSEWNTERLREDASGDSEDGEDDEMPCVIGESAGDCVWRGSRRSVGSSFHRQGAAYCIPKGAICDFQRGVGRLASKSDHRIR